MDDLLIDCLIEALQRYIYESLQEKFPTHLTKVLTLAELTLKVAQLKEKNAVDADRIHNIDQICKFIQTRSTALTFLNTNLQTFTVDELEYYLNALDRDTIATITLLSGEHTVAKTADCRIFAEKTNPFVNGTYLLSLKPFYTSGWGSHKLSSCIQNYFVDVIIDHDHYQRRYGNAKRQQWLDLHKSLLQQAQLAQAQIAEQKQAKIEQDELAERQQANAETAKTKMREILRQHQVGVESELETTRRQFQESKELVLEFSSRITQLELEIKQYQQTDALQCQQLQEQNARIQELTRALEEVKKKQDQRFSSNHWRSSREIGVPSQRYE